MTAPARRTPPSSYILIGTSAGGAVALSRVFKDLPEGFRGAILIVMHVGERSGGWLPERLERVSRIPVKLAEEGEKILQGTAYVAPSGTHLLIRRGRIALGTGPREHFSRPAVDVLFRSAASEFGPRAIGVILTGMLRDGTLGLRAIRDGGGVTIVQNPEDAEEGGMPRSAMENMNVDYCLDLSEIGPVLDLLVRRAGSTKQGVLETGLASAVRLMKDRARLLAKLHEQSQRNPKTRSFLKAEITALKRDISRIQRMIPSA